MKRELVHTRLCRVPKGVGIARKGRKGMEGGTAETAAVMMVVAVESRGGRERLVEVAEKLPLSRRRSSSGQGADRTALGQRGGVRSVLSVGLRGMAVSQTAAATAATTASAAPTTATVTVAPTAAAEGEGGGRQAGAVSGTARPGTTTCVTCAARAASCSAATHARSCSTASASARASPPCRGPGSVGAARTVSWTARHQGTDSW